MSPDALTESFLKSRPGQRCHQGLLSGVGRPFRRLRSPVGGLIPHGDPAALEGLVDPPPGRISSSNLGVFPYGHQHVFMPWWTMIFHSRMSNSMAGNDIPWWEMKFHGGEWWDFILAYPAPAPIHKGVHKGGRPPAAYPFLEPLWMGVEAG